MTYADSAERAAFISGLRGLADYLESNPGVPAPRYSTVFTFPPDGDWAEKRAEIDAVAARLGVITRENGGHYIAALSFGPIEYCTVAIPRKSSDNQESEEV